MQIGIITVTEYRLSLPDAIGYEVPADYVPMPATSQPFVMPPLPIVDCRGWKQCLYAADFVAGCCHDPATVACAWKRQRVTYGTCAACVSEMT